MADTHDYPYPIDWELIRSQCARRLHRLPRIGDHLSTANPDLHYHTSTALSGYFQGVAAAWGLEDTEALTTFRQAITDLTKLTIQRFPQDIEQKVTWFELGQFSLGQDPATFHQLLTMVRNQPTPPGQEEVNYVAPLVRAIAALGLGETQEAQTESLTANTALNHPGHAPGIYEEGLPHAIDAIARQDQTALTQAADHTITLYNNHHAPTPDLRAGTVGLIHPLLTAICRIATWHNITPPKRPQILTTQDHWN